MAPTRRTPPQHTHHAALGYFAEAAGGRLNFSAEAYYQRMYRVLEYNAPLTGMVNNRYELEQYLHSGDGEAYGMEFMVSYAGRKFNGWISYTLGKSVRQFAALNDGLPFPASLDRRHDLSLAASYMPSERWELSTVFVYASGGAYTPTRDLYIAGGRSSADTAPTTAPACRITTGSTCRSPTGCGGNRGAAASISPSSTSTPTATRSTSRGRCSSTKRSTNTRSIRVGITSTPSSPP